MDKLKKAQKDAKKDKETKKGKKEPKQITDPKQVRRKIQEDKNIRSFFKELVETTTDPEDISKSIYNFSIDPKAPWGRATILKEIIDILPPNFYADFINSFIDQENDMLPEFWNSYRSKSSVIEAIRRKDEDLTAGDIERERLRKLNQQLYGDQEGKPIMEDPDYVVGDNYGAQRSGRDKEEIDALLEEAGGLTKLEKPREKQFKIAEKIKARPEGKGLYLPGKIIRNNRNGTYDIRFEDGTKKTNVSADNIEKVGIVKMLDGDEIKDIPEQTRRKVVTTYTFIDQNCVNELNSAPWLNASVEGIFITPADKSTNINAYISQGKNNKETYQHNGETWSKVAVGFYQIMCNTFKNRQEQDGDVFTAWKNSTQPIRFKIGYKTNKGFMVQDEEMFNKQKEYSKEQKVNNKEKLDNLLKEPVNPELQKFGKETLSLALTQIAPEIYDYSVNSSYIQKAIDTIKEKATTSKEFIDMLTNTILYLEEPNAIVFKERIVREYYLPEILVTLSPLEKYPEALENQNQEFVDKNYRLMERLGAKMAENISKKYYNIMFPSNKIKQLETLYSGITDKITIGSIKGKCHNKDNIKDAPDYQVVYYEEDGKTYCLLIDDLLSQINNADGFEDVLNPETGNTIRQEFIERFYDIYGNTIREDGYEERTIEKIEEPKKEEVPKEQELAPGLVSIMLENIRKCQVETLTWGDSDDENVPEKCTSIVDDNDNLSDASSVSSLSISELDEEIFGKQSDFNSADSDSDNSSISTGDNSSGKDSDNSSISTGDKHSSMSSNNDDSPHCKVCNKRCLEQIRTIREEPKGTFLPENYCSIVCLEEEEFKKAKKTDKSEQFAAREARKDAKSSSSKDEQ
jgi:hypothetical protein